MARNTGQGGDNPNPEQTQAPQGIAPPDPRTPANRVDETPQRLPTLGQPTGVASGEIRPDERITTGEGSSAQENSGASDLADTIFGPEEEEDDDYDEADDGPKLVVLHTFVTGPGGGPHVRGKVITVRHLLGHEMLEERNRRQARRALKRYLDLKAVRPATEEESKHDFVTFPEGEEALTTALDDANARADAEKARADDLQRRIDEMRSEQGDTSKTEKTDVDSLLDEATASEKDEF